MTIVYDEHGDEVAVIDVGKQRSPVMRDTPPQLADEGGCVVCFVKAAPGSDFCTSCRDELRGTA